MYRLLADEPDGGREVVSPMAGIIVIADRGAFLAEADMINDTCNNDHKGLSCIDKLLTGNLLASTIRIDYKLFKRSLNGRRCDQLSVRDLLVRI